MYEFLTSFYCTYSPVHNVERRKKVLEAEGDKRSAELESEGAKIRMKNESEGTLIKVQNEAEARKIQLILEVTCCDVI
jgi:hypothetical protein